MGRKGANLAVVHFAGRSTLLASDAERVVPFFRKHHLIGHHHGVPGPQILEFITIMLQVPTEHSKSGIRAEEL
jgi:hypothetical protein